jgi:Tetratricopeptide repeat
MSGQWALTIEEKVFGVDYIKTADTINNLSITYGHQGRYDKAIAHHERTLRIKEKAFGVDHINTADTIMDPNINKSLIEQCRVGS